MAAVTMKHAVITLGLVLLVAACDPFELQHRQQALAAYVGRSEADVVRAMGVPSRTFDAGGHRFLAYDQSSQTITPPPYPWGFGWGYGGGFPAQVVTWTCETTFEIGDGRVVGTSLRGNAC
jgi:hypothetical protein